MSEGMPEDRIVPRWEWRTFGQHFGAAEASFAALTPAGVQESDELYLLAPGGDTVKIRFDLVDVKSLREVDGRGLERWEPTLKAGFPIGADGVRRVVDALRIDGLDVDQGGYTVDRFVDFLASSGSVRPVQVHKHRVRYTVGGCSAELSNVTADGRSIRTLAIESEDGAAVSAAVRSVGLAGYINTSYPRGLTALLDGVPPRYAVIDVGTNSVKFYVGERAADGKWRRVADRAEITRLGERLEEKGEITPEALERTIVAIAGMAEEAKRIGAVAIAAVGTAGLRAASNGADAVADILRRTGVHVEVITGQDESRLAFQAVGVELDAPDASLVVFDTGGGSSQFTFGHGIDVDERFSLPVGAARFTELFGLDRAVSSDVLDEARSAISAELARLDGRPAPDALIAMGGAVTNIAAVKHGLAVYDPDVIQGTVLDRSELDRQIELYRTRDAEDRRSIVGLQPKRGEVILAGACIVQVVMGKLGTTALTVSDRGLRHGVLIERFGSAGNARAGGPAQGEEGPE